MGNDEVGAFDSRLGDVGAEHALGHDLGLDGDRLAALGRVDQRVGEVKRIEAGLEHGRSADSDPRQPLAAQPEFEFDRLSGPGVRDLRQGGEVHRAGVHRPEVLQLHAPADFAADCELPVGYGDLAGIAPGADFPQAPDEPVQAASIENVYHPIPPGTIRATMRFESLGRIP